MFLAHMITVCETVTSVVAVQSKAGSSNLGSFLELFTKGDKTVSPRIKFKTDVNDRLKDQKVSSFSSHLFKWLKKRPALSLRQLLTSLCLWCWLADPTTINVTWWSEMHTRSIHYYQNLPHLWSDKYFELLELAQVNLAIVRSECIKGHLNWKVRIENKFCFSLPRHQHRSKDLPRYQYPTDPTMLLSSLCMRDHRGPSWANCSELTLSPGSWRRPLTL